MTPPSLPPFESLTVEFKSDLKRLTDREMVEAVVCLANAEGGELWLGVEDDGTPTGLHAEHMQLGGLAGLVAARTSPSLAVTVTPVNLNGLAVARIAVPKHSAGEVATTNGVYQCPRWTWARFVKPWLMRWFIVTITVWVLSMCGWTTMA